jgi:putative ABC transport system substrate-binding protein
MKRAWSLDDIRNPANAGDFEEMQKAARALAIEVQRFDLGNPPDLGRAFEVAIREGVEAIRVNVDGVTRPNQGLIAELAAKHKLPAIYATREFVDKGGLMSYGISYPDLYFRAASYVNKIFKGAKPGDLPVEQPMKFELVINLKTAKALGITIPPSIMVQADEWIE